MDTDANGLDLLEKSAGPRERRSRRLGLPALRLSISERRATLALVDVLLVNASLFAAVCWGLGLEPAAALAAGHAKWYVTLTVVWTLAALFFNLYDLAQAAWIVPGVEYGVLAALGAALVYVGIPRLTPPAGDAALHHLPHRLDGERHWPLARVLCASLRATLVPKAGPHRGGRPGRAHPRAGLAGFLPLFPSAQSLSWHGLRAGGLCG